MQSPQSDWVEASEGLRLRWLRWDAAAARGGVLLVHGFGDHGARYGDVGRIFGARGLVLAAYDQRGHGRSPGRRGDAPSFESFLADLDAAWAHARRTLPPPHFLYGHSFGGLVAMRWLQTRFERGRSATPERPGAVVLSAPWLALRMAVPPWKLVAARLLLRVAPALPIPSGSDSAPFLTRDPERQAAYRSDPLVHHRISSRFHAATLAAQAAALAADWPPVPTLLALPGDDPLVDADVSARWRVRHPEVAVFVREGGRHELHNDVDREESIGRIAGWLLDQPAAEPGAPERVFAPGR